MVLCALAVACTPPRAPGSRCVGTLTSTSSPVTHTHGMVLWRIVAGCYLLLMNSMQAHTLGWDVETTERRKRNIICDGYQHNSMTKLVPTKT